MAMRSWLKERGLAAVCRPNVDPTAGPTWKNHARPGKIIPNLRELGPSWLNQVLPGYVIQVRPDFISATSPVSQRTLTHENICKLWLILAILVELYTRCCTEWL